MRCEERGALEQRGQLRPQAAEVVGRLHVIPSEAVNVGEDELPGRRADQMDRALDDRAVNDFHHADRAGAVAPIAGGLEVDGDEVQRLARL